MIIIAIATINTGTVGLKYYECPEGTTCSLNGRNERIFLNQGKNITMENVGEISEARALVIEPDVTKWLSYSDTVNTTFHNMRF